MPEIREYVDDRNRSPFAAWFNTLDSMAAAKIVAVLARMEAGNLSDVKNVGEGVWERRIHTGPGYRIYFGRVGPRVILLLGGGSKRRQAWDIARAKERWKDYQTRNAQR